MILIDYCWIELAHRSPLFKTDKNQQTVTTFIIEDKIQQNLNGSYWR